MEFYHHISRSLSRLKLLRRPPSCRSLLLSLLLLELMASQLVRSQHISPPPPSPPPPPPSPPGGCTQIQGREMCPPVILTKPEEIVVGPGSNVTLACSASGSAPLTFVWFQDEKNITGNADSMTNHSEPPPSTKLLDERRYEIQEEMNAPNVTTSYLFLMDLKITDTSVFLCWVENAAGSTISNFSLIVNGSLVVNNSPHSHGSSAGLSFESFITPNDPATNIQVIIVLIAFLLLLLLTFICLFVLRQVTSNRSSKMSTGSQSSCAKNNTSLLAVEDLDGFFEHMRSGIIDIDHHSMSPAIQFNNNNNASNNLKTSGSQHSHTNSNTNLSTTNTDTTINTNTHTNFPMNLKNHDQFVNHYHLTQLNHFQTVSNASSQLAFFNTNGAGGGGGSIAPLQQPPSNGVLNQQAFYGAGQLSNASSQQAFYPGQPSTHHQQLQRPPQTTISSATSQQAFYMGQAAPQPPPPPTTLSQALGNASSQQQQAFYGGANGGQQLASNVPSQQQQAFYGGQLSDEQRTMHTLFI